MVIVMSAGDGRADPAGHRVAGGGGLRPPLHRRQPHRPRRGRLARQVVDPQRWSDPGVREVVKISAPYKLWDALQAADTVVDIAGVKVGGPESS